VTASGFVAVVSGARVDSDGEVAKLLRQRAGRNLEPAGGEEGAERLREGPLRKVETIIPASNAGATVKVDGHHPEPGHAEPEEVDDGAADAGAVDEGEEVGEGREVRRDAVDGVGIGDVPEALDEDDAGALRLRVEDDEGGEVVCLREVESGVEGHGQITARERRKMGMART